MDPVTSAYLEEARQRLEAARQRLNEEIHAYPTPIAGCDAQFNHLLAERQRVVAALDALAGEDRHSDDAGALR